jgi:hypothetical protein
MLPPWFAEYTLYLGLASLLVFVVAAVFGRVAPSNDHFTGLLIDIRRTRRPSALISVIALIAGFGVLGIGISSSTSHFGLAMSGLGSVLLLLGISAGVSLPFQVLWTNDYWKLPPPETMTADEARVLARSMGHVYTIAGVGCFIAVAGALIGIIPKLVYVGEAPIPAIFLVADFLLIASGGILLFRGWRLFRSVRVQRAGAH